jgi:hypothetical protein
MAGKNEFFTEFKIIDDGFELIPSSKLFKKFKLEKLYIKTCFLHHLIK